MSLRRASSPLVHVVEHNINEQVGWIIHVCSLHREGAQLLCHLVPAEELSKVYVANFKCTDVLEGE